MIVRKAGQHKIGFTLIEVIIATALASNNDWVFGGSNSDTSRVFTVGRTDTRETSDASWSGHF